MHGMTDGVRKGQMTRALDGYSPREHATIYEGKVAYLANSKFSVRV
jgi:hypothetical protein